MIAIPVRAPNVFAATFWLWLLAAGWAFAQPSFPPLSGRVVDQANVLSPAAEQQLAQRSEALEQQTGSQFVVVTVASLEGYDIADYGYQLGRAWGIGREGEDDGALLIVAPTDRKVRVEVGYGLEGVLTDAFSNLVLQREVLPRFREGELEAGVLAGAEAIAAQIAADPERQQEALSAAAETQEQPGIDPVAIIWIIFLVIWMIGAIANSSRFGRRYRRGGLGLPPVIIWGGGGGGGGGFGGGGFSGGGGSFGGGGSSGSW